MWRRKIKYFDRQKCIQLENCEYLKSTICKRWRSFSIWPDVQCGELIYKVYTIEP